MLPGLRRFIGDWGILAIGVLAMLVFIGIASYLAPSTPPAASSASNGQSTPTAQPRTAAQASPPAAAVKPAPPSAATAPASQPAGKSASAQSPAPAPAQSSALAQHAMPVPSTAQQTSGQAAQPAATRSGAGDAAAGRQVFRKCQACHSLEPGKNLSVPGSPASSAANPAALPNYDYSPAMKQANITWDAQDARRVSGRSRKRSCPATRCRSPA